MAPGLVVLGNTIFAQEVEDVASAAGLTVLGVAGDADPLPAPGAALAVAAENLTVLRARLVRRAEEHGLGFAAVVHPAAIVSGTARLGPGTLVWPRAVIGRRARLGAHALVNRGALVGAGAELEDFVTVSPGAAVGDGVSLGEGVYVGMGAVIEPGRRVGARSVVGSGAVVSEDVPERVQVLGVPARIAKRA